MTATIPDLDGFDTYYGVKISFIGEDGAMVMLGHVDDRHAIAVARAYQRHLVGRVEADNYLWNRLGLYPSVRNRAAERGVLETLNPVARSYAVVVKHCDRWPTCQAPDGECGGPVTCQGLASDGWWLKCDADPTRPGAFPVSYWAE